MRALLDINVLLALFDSAHQFHDRARTWLDKNIEPGWASCPLTQNGFARIISQADYPNRIPPAQAIEYLAEACSSPHHQFWPDTISILDPVILDRARLHGPKQLTDAYLLALAVLHRGCFVTFDSRTTIAAVVGATKNNLQVL